MLFKLLKLFGLDVRAEFAAVKGQIEQRVEEAAGRARHAALAVAVIVALSTLAGLFCLMAIGVGLFALYRAGEAAYGANVALGIVAAVLVAATLILLGIAWMLGRSSAAEPASSGEKLAEAVVSAAPASPPPEALASPPVESSGDLIEPLGFLLSLFAKDPKLGHPVLDEFVTNLRTPAGGKADEAVDQALNLVRNGDRTQLLIILGGAVAAGWLLARSRPAAPPDYDTTPK